MNIGIEKLGLKKRDAVSLEQFEEAFADLMDETEATSEFASFERYEKLLSIGQSVSSCKNFEGAVELLKTDANLVAQFGAKKPMAGILKEIKASEEILLTGAAIAGGAAIVAGGAAIDYAIVIAIIRAAQKNLRRVKTACLFALDNKLDPAKIQTAQCKVLCPPEVFMRSMEALKKIGKGISDMVKDPNSKFATIAEGLREVGVSIKPNGKPAELIAKEWKPAFYGRSSNKGALAQRGWDEKTIKAAAKELVDHINAITSIKDAKSVKIQKGAEDYKMKQRFVAKAAKLYVKAIKDQGRALAIAINKVKAK